MTLASPAPTVKVTTDGMDRYVYDYFAYPHQKAFHESRAKHRLLGGAAGPGKTLALIEDHMLACRQFPRETAPQVHTLILRRTHPKLTATVITRFREKIPKELYKDFNESKGIVTWHNGATTQFGSMQYEHDVWGWQGQWYKIAYDELTEFTFGQWQNISAWNRCPVSKRATKDGATNPIGIGARWVEDLFLKHHVCVEMDANQKREYVPEDYVYFPATYRSNPVYANDENYIKNLNSYQEAVSKALKEGIWGIAGGYFDGAWDEAYNVYPAGSVDLVPWGKRWLGGDWGFDHDSAIYWLHEDDAGLVKIYRELVINKHTPEELGERIVRESRPDATEDEDGNDVYDYELFSFSHDAFASHRMGKAVNSIGIRLGAVLRKAGIIQPQESTRDKVGREQILYDFLKARVKTGQTFNDDTGHSEPITVAKLQIADCCPRLIRTIPGAPRDEKKSEEIAEFLGDDPLQGAGYGLYAKYGKPRGKPLTVRVKEKVQAYAESRNTTTEELEPTSRAMLTRRAVAIERAKGGRRGYRAPIWHPRTHQ